MKEELLSNNSDNLIRRFNNFHDGLIRNVEIEYPRDSITPRITIVVEARDWEAKEEEWVNIILEIQDVTTFNLTQNELYTYCVILRFKVGFFNERVYLNFAGGSPKTPPALDYFEKSPFLIVGERCFWYTTPYIENNMD